jgi:hypothetical protein
MLGCDAGKDRGEVGGICLQGSLSVSFGSGALLRKRRVGERG